MKIIKSDAVKQKEAQLNQCQKQHAKINKQLKTTKQKLEDFKVCIEDVSSHSIRYMTVLDRFRKQKMRHAENLKKMSKSKKISAAERREFKELYEQDMIQANFMNMFSDGFSMPEFDEEEIIRHHQENANDHRSRFEKMFGDFKQSVPEVEKQQIRKVYLRLAAQFHPDKVQNKTQIQTFHQIMQQINNAYENNDLGALLEMEAQYAAMDFSLPNEKESGILDFLERQISRLNIEISLIEQQLLRTKAELKDLKASDFGRAATIHQENLKSGEVERMDENINIFEIQIEAFTYANDGYEYFLEHGKYPEGFEEKMIEYNDKVNELFDNLPNEDEYDDDTDDFDDMSPEEMMALFELLEQQLAKNTAPKAGSRRAKK